ncbi:GIY-YIG nuclease family protein [Microbacterium aureliae]
MPHVYILECADGTYYTGSTIDLDRRLAEHQSGEGAVYTRKRRPVRLVWCAEHDRVEDAFGWEKRIQGWSRAKKQLLIAERYAELPGYSSRARARGR